jgi:hypothetical protein
MRLDIPDAVGICRDCGIGVCSRHGLRKGPGEPLLCSDCADRRTRAAQAEREPVALGAF